MLVSRDRRLRASHELARPALPRPGPARARSAARHARRAGAQAPCALRLAPPIAIVARCPCPRARPQAADLAFRPLISPGIQRPTARARDLPARLVNSVRSPDLRALRSSRASGRAHLGGMTRCGGLVRESIAFGECLTRSLELRVELRRAPRLRRRGAELLRSPRACATASLNCGALARGFDLRRQLDDPLLAPLARIRSAAARPRERAARSSRFRRAAATSDFAAARAVCASLRAWSNEATWRDSVSIRA